ncbi:MAG: DUF3037 domain-containing protein [Sphingomonadaceae bacterium]
MTGKVSYAIIQIGDDQRGERLNAGVAFFTDGGLDVRFPRRLEKLRALSSSLDLDKVRDSLFALSEYDQPAAKSGASVEDRIVHLSSLSAFHFSGISQFVAPSADAYESWARRLLSIFVEPEPAIPTKFKRRTRLTTSIKKAFRDQRILARRGEDLNAHRVIADFHIADGLSADFVLKNGAMHVIETVDASSDVITLRKAVSEIAISALVLEQARMTFGERKTQARLIYDASASIEKLASPSLEAAAHQGAKLINWASHDERRSLIVQLEHLAEPLQPRSAQGLAGIHASTQEKLKLN